MTRESNCTNCSLDCLLSFPTTLLPCSRDEISDNLSSNLPCHGKTVTVTLHDYAYMHRGCIFDSCSICVLALGTQKRRFSPEVFLSPKEGILYPDVMYHMLLSVQYNAACTFLLGLFWKFSRRYDIWPMDKNMWRLMR